MDVSLSAPLQGKVLFALRAREVKSLLSTFHLSHKLARADVPVQKHATHHTHVYTYVDA